MSASTLPSSSNNNKSERPSPRGWQQIWATIKSSTKRLLGLDDEGLR